MPKPHGCRRALHALVACAGGAAVWASSEAWADDVAAEPAASAPADADTARLNILVANLTLDGLQVSDTVYLYEFKDDVLLPVGELARQLTIGVTVDPVSHVASGFLLREGAAFRIDPATRKVTLIDRQEDYDPAQVRWIDGDLFVASRLLSRWWPVDFTIDMASLSLSAAPREKLPIQLRLEREKAASRLGQGSAGYQDPGYPRLDNPYALATVPVIDSTLSVNVSRNDGAPRTVGSYSGVFAGDLAGMAATGYLSLTSDKPAPNVTLTLARNDPEGGLLGPLRATSVQVGNIGLPALQNVLSGGGVGWGGVVSNRPLNQSSSYGLQTLRGSLPQGWDVTLYFNDALVSFVTSRGDGLYEFPDLPLAFGRNEFRLVFNGPLGQRRVETQVFMLDQTVTKPGQVYYSTGVKRDNAGAVRSTVQLDAGVFKGLAVTAGGVFLDKGDGGPTHAYVNGGLRASVLDALVSFDVTQDALQGGALAAIDVRTAIQRISIQASRIWLNHFASDTFSANGGGLRFRDQLNLSGALPLGAGLKLPFGLIAKHDQTESGVSTYDIAPRLSLNALGTGFTNTLDYQISPGGDTFTGAFQMSRRFAGLGLTSQVSYALQPTSALTSLSLAVDRSLNEHNRVTFGLNQGFNPARTTVTAGWTRNFGPFALGLSGTYGGPRNMGFGLQLFTSLGRNPATGRLVADWQPMAGMGAVEGRVFIDRNMNGRYDPGEELIENAGFTVNGSGRSEIRTDDHGQALLPRLQPNVYADLALDTGTLEDASWQPTRPGVRILPRAGRTQLVDFPVVLTSQIDGSVYLETEGRRRGIGNAKLQLLDAAGRVAGETQSSSDGYYILPNIPPGRYWLRISPDQLAALKLTANRTADITINARADFVNGIDFTLARPTPPTPDGREPAGPPAAPPPRPEPAPSAGAHSLALQAGSFRDPAHARAELSRLRRILGSGFSALDGEITPATAFCSARYRVRFRSTQRAPAIEAACSRLTRMHVGCIIVRATRQASLRP